MIEEPTIYIKRLRPDVKLPCYAMPGDAGLDVFMPEGYTRRIPMGCIQRIPLGFAVAIPDGYFGWLTNKSSRYAEGLYVHGIIDSGYRGQVCAQLHTMQSVNIEAGEKLCQLLIIPVAQCRVVEVDELGDTVRGSGGFGSTGKR